MAGAKKPNEITRRLAQLISRHEKWRDVVRLIVEERRGLGQWIRQRRMTGYLTHDDARQILIDRIKYRLEDWMRGYHVNPPMSFLDEALLAWESGVDYRWLADRFLADWERYRQERD